MNMNTELILNPHIAPVYVIVTNMVIPLTQISFEDIYPWFEYIYNNLVEYITTAKNFITIISYTSYFIIKQFVLEIYNIMTYADKIILALSVYNLIIFIYKIYKLNNELNYKLFVMKEEIENLEKNIIYLKKADRMREDWEQLWGEEVKYCYNEHNNKYKELVKDIKKIKKQLIEYQ